MEGNSMIKKRGKIPSLLVASTGMPCPRQSVKQRKCSRCCEIILSGSVHVDIPKKNGGYSNKKPHCVECFKEILEQTKIDISKLEKSIFNSNT